MDTREAKVRERIQELLDSQKFAVLSTQRHGQPYASLMAFAHTEDLSAILVATGTTTRKHVNIIKEPRVSLLFDNRSNADSDFHAATALTAVGTIMQVVPQERENLQSLYLRRHPGLEAFLKEPATAFLKIIIRHYLLVNQFQQVMELHLSDEKDLFAPVND